MAAVGYGAVRSDQYTILSGALARIINVLIWSVVTGYGRAGTAVSALASRIIEFILLLMYWSPRLMMPDGTYTRPHHEARLSRMVSGSGSQYPG